MGLGSLFSLPILHIMHKRTEKWYISIEHVGNLKTRGMTKRSCHDLVSPSKVAEQLQLILRDISIAAAIEKPQTQDIFPETAGSLCESPQFLRS